MTHPAKIDFVDRDSGEEGFAMIRVEGDVVGLALSLKGNGDIEAFLGERELGGLIDALREAQATIAHQVEG